MGDAAGELADRFHLLPVRRAPGGPSLSNLDPLPARWRDAPVLLLNRGIRVLTQRQPPTAGSHEFPGAPLRRARPLQSPLIAGMPGVPENHGVSQKGRPITSSSFAPMPDNDAGIGIEQGAVQGQQALICVARFEMVRRRASAVR